MTGHRAWVVVALALGLSAVSLHGRVAAFPVDGNQTTLPPGTELDEDALDKPREAFHSEFAISASRFAALAIQNLGLANDVLASVSQPVRVKSTLLRGLPAREPATPRPSGAS